VFGWLIVARATTVSEHGQEHSRAGAAGLSSLRRRALVTHAHTHTLAPAPRCALRSPDNKHHHQTHKQTAEILKRRVVGLHQISEIGSTTVVDVYEPKEEGLDT
jgi:hypothetical protein